MFLLKMKNNIFLNLKNITMALTDARLFSGIWIILIISILTRLTWQYKYNWWVNSIVKIFLQASVILHILIKMMNYHIYRSRGYAQWLREKYKDKHYFLKVLGSNTHSWWKMEDPKDPEWHTIKTIDKWMLIHYRLWQMFMDLLSI